MFVLNCWSWINILILSNYCSFINFRGFTVSGTGGGVFCIFVFGDGTETTLSPILGDDRPYKRTRGCGFRVRVSWTCVNVKSRGRKLG